MTEAFTSSAEYYEVLSDSDARLDREGPLLRDTFRSAPGMLVVDIACGTGIHSEFFGRLGARVDAFDISAEMIALAARRHSHPTVTYHTGDMRALSGGPWDYAICLGNSLSVLTDTKDLGMTFRAVFSSLTQGGVFVLQILNYRGANARKPRHRIEHRRTGGADIVAVKSLVPHGDRTLLSLSFYRTEGDDWTSLSETAVLKNWSKEDMENAAHAAGFTVKALYGGFDRSEFDPNESADLVIVNRKT